MLKRRSHKTIVTHYGTFFDPRLQDNFRLPLVHIRLKQGDKSFRTDALVDSGATATFVPIELVNILGFGLKPEGEPQTEDEAKKTPKEDAVGAGGIFKTYRAEIDLIQVLKGSTPFCEFPNCNVLVPSQVGAIPHAILGRDTIFSEYDVTFRENKQLVVFRLPKS